mmetsp:Transcript_16178/g.22719  ORF Transcript_16178/g.22719 Transcript_16178/m.22719 type:complete len:256 (+) Transcript_16178:81-848(+)
MGCYISTDERQESLCSVEIVETKVLSQVKRPSILRNSRVSSQWHPHTDSTLRNQLNKSPCYDSYDPSFNNEAGILHLAPRSTVSSLSPGSSDDNGDEPATLGAADTNVYVNPIAVHSASSRTTTSIPDDNHNVKFSKQSSSNPGNMYTGGTSLRRRSHNAPLLVHPSRKEGIINTIDAVVSSNIRKRNHVTFSHDSIVHLQESKKRRAKEQDPGLQDLFRGPEFALELDLNRGNLETSRIRNRPNEGTPRAAVRK